MSVLGSWHCINTFLLFSYDIIVFMGLFNFFKKKNDGTGSIGGVNASSTLEPLHPRDINNVNDNELDGMLRMGSFLMPYHENTILGINNNAGIVVYDANGGAMLIRAHAQEKHGYRWMHAIALLRSTGHAEIIDGKFGDEALVHCESGDVRIIGHDADKWYVTAYITGGNDNSMDTFDWIFAHMAIDRGVAPMAPTERLNPAYPDEDELSPVQNAPSALRFRVIHNDDADKDESNAYNDSTENEQDDSQERKPLTVDVNSDKLAEQFGLNDDEKQVFEHELNRRLKAIQL